MLGQSILSTGVVEMISISLAEQLQGAAAKPFTAKRILPRKITFHIILWCKVIYLQLFFDLQLVK